MNLHGKDIKIFSAGSSKNMALSICSNSQYTKSRIKAEVAYIEFLPLKDAEKSK